MLCPEVGPNGSAESFLNKNNALAALRGEGVDLMDLLTAAWHVRRKRFGNRVTIHVLDNIRNGACPEDCGYCGQSAESKAQVQPYKLKSVDAIVADAAIAQSSGAYRFCMAISGRGPSDRDVDHLCQAISQIRDMGMRTCLSAGLLDEEKARRLKSSGLDRLNHNLNTSRQHYPQICTTHTFDDRLRTLQAAKTSGLGLCSGLIVGMGESLQDVLDVILTLRDLKVESIPVNFLLPIPGNRTQNAALQEAPLSPTLVLRILSVTRLLCPDAEVRIAAGREAHLRSLQPLALWPANSLFMEGYLLTEGQEATQTIQMILDAGFEPVLEHPEAAGPELQKLLKTAQGHSPELLLKQAVRKNQKSGPTPLTVSIPGRS